MNSKPSAPPRLDRRRRSRSRFIAPLRRAAQAARPSGRPNRDRAQPGRPPWLTAPARGRRHRSGAATDRVGDSKRPRRPARPSPRAQPGLPRGHGEQPAMRPGRIATPVSRRIDMSGRHAGYRAAPRRAAMCHLACRARLRPPGRPGAARAPGDRFAAAVPGDCRAGGRSGCQDRARRGATRALPADRGTQGACAGHRYAGRLATGCHGTSTTPDAGIHR